MSKLSFILAVLLISSFSATQLCAQDFEAEKLPHYVVVTAETTKLIGGMNIIVYKKKSAYKAILGDLEEHLQSTLKIRNMTDLLNTMYDIGFEYVNAYESSADAIGAGTGDDLEIFGSESKTRSNIVFKRK